MVRLVCLMLIVATYFLSIIDMQTLFAVECKTDWGGYQDPWWLTMSENVVMVNICLVCISSSQQ